MLHTISIATVVALAILSLLAIQGISHASVSSLVDYSLAKIPEGDRTITVTSNNIIASPADFNTITENLSKEFDTLIKAGMTREILYHELADTHGIGFYFGGADGIEKLLTLNSGRLPRTCSPSLCEVIQIDTAKRTDGGTPQTSAYGLIVVGKATFTSGTAFTGTFGPDNNVPFYLADGVIKAASLLSLKNSQGANGWVGEINRDTIEKMGPGNFIQSVVQAENQIAISEPGLALTWPQDSLSEADSNADALRTKFDLLSYAIGAFLIILVVLFSIRRRTDHLQFRSGLSRIGTPRKVLVQELLIEYSAPIILGIGVGLLISHVIRILLHLFDFKVSYFNLFAGQEKNLLIFLIAFLLSVGTAIHGEKAWGRWPILIFVMAILLNFIYFALRGANDSRAWILPLIGVALPLWITYLLLPRLSTLIRKRASSTYVILHENLRIWQGVAAILSLTTLLAVLTLSYDSGISKEINIQAEDRVPLNIAIKTGPTLTRPLDRGGTSDYEKLSPGTRAFPILRTGSSIRTQNAIADSLLLLGMAPSALSYMDTATLRDLKKVLTPGIATNEPGINVGSAGTLTVGLTNIPKEVDLVAWFRTPRGTHTSFIFNGHGRTRTLNLLNRVPEESLLTAFELRETSEYLSRRLHALGEGSFGVSMLKGVGSITRVLIGNRNVDLAKAGWGINKFAYSFDGNSLYLRPAWETKIPNVVVDPTTAGLGKDGILTLSSEGNSSFQVRVGAIREHFPSAGDRFVIMDLNQLQAEFSKSSPGSSDPIEIWVTTSDETKYLDALHHSIFKDLSFTSKTLEKERVHQDPTNIGLDGSYKVALLYAFLVSLFLFGTALPLLRKDGAAGLFQLEVNGAGPNSLRRSLRSSMRMTLINGMLVGVSFGALVTHYYISQSTPLLTISVMLVIALLLSEAGTYALTRRFFIEPTMVEVQ